MAIAERQQFLPRNGQCLVQINLPYKYVGWLGDQIILAKVPLYKGLLLMMKFSTVFTPQLYPCLSNVMSVLGQAKRGRFVFPDHTRTLKCALRGGRGRNPSALLL